MEIQGTLSTVIFCSDKICKRQANIGITGAVDYVLVDEFKESLPRRLTKQGWLLIDAQWFCERSQPEASNPHRRLKTK